MDAVVSKLEKFILRRGGTPYAVVVVMILYRLWLDWRSKPRGVFIANGGRHWPFGSTLEFLDIIRAHWQNEHLEALRGWHYQYGKTFASKILFQPWWVMTACPKNVEHILSTNFPNYPKGPWVVRKLSDLLGRGIFNADGQEWYHQRKTISQMFTAKPFKEHSWAAVRRNARKLRDLLLSSAEQQPLDISGLMHRFTLDTIGEIGFGKSIGSLEDPSSSFLLSFDSAQRIASKRFFTPHWRLLKCLGVGSERTTQKHLNHLDEYTRSIVRDLQDSIARKSDGAKSSGISWADMEARKSLVGLFLADAKKRRVTLSEDYLRDLVLNFLMVGRDAPAQTLSWTIYCLCKHPEVAEKARTEISEICGVRGPSCEDLDRLPYLQAVLNEALRFFPTVPLEPKVAAEDDTWPDGTFIPRGTVVFFNVFAMGRDSSLWGEDAETFRPERWLEMSTPPNCFEYPIFHAGPRECLGKHLAQVEMKACLAIVLPQISFQLAVPEDEITHDGTLTIGMRRGLPCFIKKLESRKSSKENPGSNSSTVDHSESEPACSDYTSGCSEYSEVASEEETTRAQASLYEESRGRSFERKGRNRSGRARQRERRRRQVTTPSPER